MGVEKTEQFVEKFNLKIEEHKKWLRGIYEKTGNLHWKSVLEGVEGAEKTVYECLVED